jgi:Tfp pilus assembly protein PilO
VKRSDATVLAVVAVVALIAGFWFMVLAPKRSQVSDLSAQANDLQMQLSQQQQTVATAHDAQADYAPSYHKLVVLGKAVPADAEQASLIVQLSSLATRAGVSFRSLTLSPSPTGSTTTAAPTTPTTSTGTDTTSTSTTDTSTTSTTPTSTTSTTTSESTPTASSATALPTEASAALLPLGAGVGPAGLPVMPYQLTFTGGYFQISKFLHEVDNLVHTGTDTVTVSGRLLTVNSFDLAPPENSATAGGGGSGATLEAKLSVTSYVEPPGQGITAGATPTGPATTPSSTVPTSSAAPTSSATPTADTAPTTP